MRWKLYKALNYNGKVVGIFLAKSTDLIYAYYQGMSDADAELHPNSLEQIKFDSDILANHPTGIVPLIRTDIITVRGDNFNSHKEIVIKK